MKRNFLLILTSLIFIPAISQTIFLDDFNRTSIGSNWAVRYGNWSIENNQLKHVGDGTFDANFILYANSITANEYTVECRIMWKQNGFFEDGISLFHKPLDIIPETPWGKQDSYFLAYLSNYNGNEARLARLNPNTTNTWFDLRVDVKKTNSEYVELKYYVFDKLVLWMAGTVEALLADNVGLGGFKGQYGQVVYFDDFKIYGPSGYTSVGEQSGNLPEGITVYPNPLEMSSTLEFNLSNSLETRIDMYTLSGELVNQLLVPAPKPGVNRIQWDGKNSQGKRMESGTYFLQLINGNVRLSGKLLLMN
jgi:hypothetical protein